MTTYNTLRDANIARQREWVTGAPLSMSFRGNELGGEIGEVAEVLFGANYATSRHHRDSFIVALGNEIADSIICTDLLALDLGCDPFPTVIGHSVVLDDFRWATDMLIELGAVQNIIKKFERHVLGIAGGVVPDRYSLGQRLFEIHRRLRDLAWTYRIDPDEAVAKKFNHTSIKVGLETRLTTSGV